MKYDPLCPTVLDQDELVNVVGYSLFVTLITSQTLSANESSTPGYEGISLLSVVKLRIRILIFSCMLAKLK